MSEPQIPPLKAPRLPRYWGTDTGQQFLTAKAARLLDELAFACPSKSRTWLIERALADYLLRLDGA